MKNKYCATCLNFQTKTINKTYEVLYCKKQDIQVFCSKPACLNYKESHLSYLNKIYLRYLNDNYSEIEKTIITEILYEPDDECEYTSLRNIIIFLERRNINISRYKLKKIMDKLENRNIVKRYRKRRSMGYFLSAFGYELKIILNNTYKK